MAASPVSASANIESKTVAPHRLQPASTTASEAIRSPRDRIAATEAPLSGPDGHQIANEEGSEAFQRLMELRAAVPGNTPLARMSSADIRRELMMRAEQQA